MTLTSFKLMTIKVTRKTRKAQTILGIEIDNKLNFEKHVAGLCWKAGQQLNALSRIH